MQTDLFDSSDFGQFKNFEAASREVLAFLHKRLGFGLWMMTRTVGNDWIVLQVEDHYYNVQEGTVFNWCDSFCSRMVIGEGPQIAPNSDLVAVYKNAEIGRKVKIGAYIGVPIYQKDTTLFGTLCAIDPNPQSEDIHQELPLINLMGKMLATLLVVDEMNITLENQAHENQRLQKKAEDTTKAKSEFLATMSHEIRTPMNGVIGMLGLLEKSNLEAAQRHQVAVATSSATSLLVLVNDILDFSKIEAGKMDFEMLEVDLKHELESCIESIAFKAEEKGLELVLNTNEVTHPNIITDAGRLRQILTNLVGNAVKFTNRGQIRINASLHKDNGNHGCLRIDVIDTGIGIPNEKIDTLFKAFTQADGSTTRKYGGTGLGLSIVKKLCELMGGSISATSIHGEGSTFSVDLNVELGSDGVISQAVEQDSNEDTISWPSDVRILLVEDNTTNQLVAQGMLDSLGLYADIAANGLEALEAIQISNDTQPYSIVLMDCQMPEMDGYDATRAIREGQAGEENKQLPIIAMTANAMQGDREKCSLAGMDDYITKPINLSVLKSILIKWILKGQVSKRSYTEPSTVPKTILTDLPLWDEVDTLHRLGNNSVLLNKVIESFLSDGRNSLVALSKALDENSSEDARLHAHSLNGSAGNIGATKLQTIAKYLEQEAKKKNLSKVKAGLQECQTTLDETLTVLKIHLEKEV